MTDYFSDREQGSQPRTKEAIDEIAWQGLFAMVQGRFDSGLFGYCFPETCPDGNAICGTNISAFWHQARAEMPRLSIVEGTAEAQWPPSVFAVPSTIAILDFLEFAARAVGGPIRGRWHDYFQHHHLTFDRDAGLLAFVEDVNRLLARSGVAFELTANGQARRLLPDPIGQAVRETLFHTGDGETDDRYRCNIE
jgi:hypothetical protein